MTTSKTSFQTPQCFKFKGHKGEVTALVCSPMEAIVASASWDVICIWNLHTKQCIQRIKNHARENFNIVNIQFSPDGKLLMVETDDLQLFVWDWKSGNQVFQKDNEYYSQSRGMIPQRKINHFSPDGSLLIHTTPDGRNLIIWDITKNESAHEISVFTRNITCLDLSCDGRFLAVNAVLLEKRRDGFPERDEGFRFLLIDFCLPNVGRVHPIEALISAV